MDYADLNDRVGLAPPKTSRVSKITTNVLHETTNDENKMQQLPPLSEEAQQLREQYGQHKRMSKSRDRSSNTTSTRLNDYQTAPSTNKYKRSSATF